MVDRWGVTKKKKKTIREPIWRRNRVAALDGGQHTPPLFGTFTPSPHLHSSSSSCFHTFLPCHYQCQASLSMPAMNVEANIGAEEECLDLEENFEEPIS
jgi:hypothetical protein